MDADDETIIERWEERAAIMEYCGGKSRKSADRLAAIQIKRMFGRLPDVILEQLGER